MYHVIFIANGSPQIGMGHVIRCLSLAEQFRKEYYNVNFITRYIEGKKEIQRHNFSVDILEEQKQAKREQAGFAYGTKEELEEDLCKIERILVEENPDIIIVDSYNVSRYFFISLKKYCKLLAYIDDRNEFEYPVDFIINGNISADDMGYSKQKGRRLLLGLKYNPVREEFQGIKKRIAAKEARNILITTGASDPFDITSLILNICCQELNFRKHDFHVIIGPGFQKSHTLSLLSENFNNIHLYINVNNIADIMLHMDIAFCAGGSTIYELCACGVPSFVFLYAENQRPAVNKLAENDYIWYLGEYNHLDEIKVMSMYQKILTNQQARQAKIDKIQTLVDGKGTSRIVEQANTYLKELE